MRGVVNLNWIHLRTSRLYGNDIILFVQERNQLTTTQFVVARRGCALLPRAIGERGVRDYTLSHTAWWAVADRPRSRRARGAKALARGPFAIYY